MPLRLSKKSYRDFFEVYRFCLSRKRSRAAKPAKNENTRFFIRFAVHAAEAGLKRPLTIPGVFDDL